MAKGQWSSSSSGKERIYRHFQKLQAPITSRLIHIARYCIFRRSIIVQLVLHKEAFRNLNLLPFFSYFYSIYGKVFVYVYRSQKFVSIVVALATRIACQSNHDVKYQCIHKYIYRKYILEISWTCKYRIENYIWRFVKLAVR